MLKLCGAVLVFFAAAGLGFFHAGKVRKKYEELLYLKKVIFMFRGEINYNISVMSEIFFHMSERLRTPYHEIFENLSREMEENQNRNFSDMWNETVIKHLGEVIVCDRDLDKLKELGENLGFLDKDMQMNYINLYLENLSLSIAENRDKVQADEKLSRVLGILAGIFIIVFLW